MKLTRVCQLNGEIYSMNIPALTPERLAEGTMKRNKGALIQNAFPYLTAEEREFIQTGTPPHVWDEMFGNE